MQLRSPQRIPGKITFMYYQDLSEHVGALVSLLGLFAGMSGLLVWRMLVRLEKKVDELAHHFCMCREELGERFVPRFEHEVEHHGMWEALNYHGHDMRGRVVR
jgi:hypothetical protein